MRTKTDTSVRVQQSGLQESKDLVVLSTLVADGEQVLLRIVARGPEMIDVYPGHHCHVIECCAFRENGTVSTSGTTLIDVSTLGFTNVAVSIDGDDVKLIATYGHPTETSTIDLTIDWRAEPLPTY